MVKYTEITVISIDATAFTLPVANTKISITAAPSITINLVVSDGVFTEPVADIIKFYGANTESETLSNVAINPIEIERLSGKINGTRVEGALLGAVILKKPMTYTPGMLARLIPDTCVVDINFNITSKIIDDSFIENLVTRDKLQLIMKCGYQKIGINPEDCHRERETFQLPSEGDGSMDASLVTGVEINHEPIHHAKGVVRKGDTTNGSLANLLITYPGLGYQEDYPPVMEFYSMNRVTEVAALSAGGTSSSDTIIITLVEPNPDIQVNQIVTGGNIGTTTPGTVYVHAITSGHDDSLVPVTEALVENGNLEADAGLGGDGYRCHPLPLPPNGAGTAPDVLKIGIGKKHIVAKIDIDTIQKIKPGLPNLPWQNILPDQIANMANLAEITARNTEVTVMCVSNKYSETKVIGQEDFKCFVSLENPATVSTVSCS